MTIHDKLSYFLVGGIVKVKLSNKTCGHIVVIDHNQKRIKMRFVQCKSTQNATWKLLHPAWLKGVFRTFSWLNPIQERKFLVCCHNCWSWHPSSKQVSHMTADRTIKLLNIGLWVWVFTWHPDCFKHYLIWIKEHYCQDIQPGSGLLNTSDNLFSVHACNGTLRYWFLPWKLPKNTETVWTMSSFMIDRDDSDEIKCGSSGTKEHRVCIPDSQQQTWSRSCFRWHSVLLSKRGTTWNKKQYLAPCPLFEDWISLPNEKLSMNHTNLHSF